MPNIVRIATSPWVASEKAIDFCRLNPNVQMTTKFNVVRAPSPKTRYARIHLAAHETRHKPNP
jgi:hypothetical protein